MVGTQNYKKRKMTTTYLTILIVGFFVGIPLGNLIGSSQAQSQIHFTIAYSSEKATWMGEVQQKFTQWWQVEHPNLVLKTEFHPYGSQDSMIGILTEEIKPIIWSPASTIWIPILNSRWQEQGAIYEGQTIISNISRVIYSPVVIATWESFLDKYNITGFNSLHDIIESNPGKVKLAHTDPRLSNSGFMSVIMEVSSYFHVDPQNLLMSDLLNTSMQDWLTVIESAAVQYGTSTGFLADLMTQLGPAGVNVVFLYENLIREISDEYQGDRIVAIYPEEGVLFSDHPFCVLNASWVDEQEAFVAQEFLRFINQRSIVELAMSAGFRPIDPSIPLDADVFNYETHGIRADYNSPELAIPHEGAVLQRISDVWLITRPVI